MAAAGFKETIMTYGVGEGVAVAAGVPLGVLVGKRVSVGRGVSKSEADRGVGVDVMVGVEVTVGVEVRSSNMRCWAIWTISGVVTSAGMESRSLQSR